MPTYEAYRYAADGHAGEQVPGGHSDGEIICVGTLDECREAIRQTIGPYFSDPNCRWGGGINADDDGAPGCSDVEAYHESAEIGCGGYAIRPAAS